MHPTSLSNCQKFFDGYGESLKNSTKIVKVLEIGSQDVNGSIRSCCPVNFEYIGVDFVAGKGVDIVLDDPYVLPFNTESFDAILSSSCFEHSEMFWLLYLEIMRVLKPTGLFYLNVPSNGRFHRYPVDCWRFYPDSGNALITWAKRNGMDPILLESYTSAQHGPEWNDFVAVFLKDRKYLQNYPNRIIKNKKNFTNGLMSENSSVINHAVLPEDVLKLEVIKRIINNEIKVNGN